MLKKSKIKLVVAALTAGIGATPQAHATETWSPYSAVGYVRTYDGINFSIGLLGFTCPNEKDYFYVTGLGNNDSFHAVALTSLTTGKKVKILYDPGINPVHCYVKGIEIQH